MKRRVWWLLAIGVVLALALAACGGGGAAEPTADAGAGPELWTLRPRARAGTRNLTGVSQRPASPLETESLAESARCDLTRHGPTAQAGVDCHG